MPVNTSYINRHCPICNGNDDLIPHSVVSKIKAEDLLFDELVDNWIGIFGEKVFFSYSRCKKCSLLFSPTYFNKEQLKILYSSMPQNMSTVVSNECLNRTHRGYYAVSRQYGLRGGDYLEIGPDTGMFINSCLKNGNLKKLYLYEPNKLVWKSLEDKLRGEDYQISVEMSDFHNIPDNSVLSAVMIHVLDHLVDPVNTLESIRDKLHEKGIIVIVAHDESSLLAKLASNRWPAYCLQHPQLFNRVSIKKILMENGYRILHTRKTINYFPTKFIIDNILRILNLDINVKIPVFKAFNIPLKLGNIITIATPSK
jgi:hypothetical protein